MPDAEALESTPKQADPLRSALLQGVLLGTAYGVLLRGFIILQQWIQRRISAASAMAPADPARLTHFLHVLMGWDVTAEVMTVAFLVVGPLVLGLLTIRRLETLRRSSVWLWIMAPWLAVFCMMLIIALFAWEGAICVAMALPITMLLASVGGVIGGLAARRWVPSTNQTLSIALLPFVLAPTESLLSPPTQIRTVASEIRIHATPNVVWQNIERVPPITPVELRPNWTHRIGFPRPVEATLSYEGVGGVRHASFERGLLFIETVTAWEPEHRLAFNIAADAAHIPPTTLDEHVTIGGRYFDVLDGEYTLEPLPGGDILLHLTSHQRLSTDFNGYAGFWTDAVMQSLQTSILNVIQHRCEAEGRAGAVTASAQVN